VNEQFDGAIPALLDGVRVDRALATLTGLSRAAVQEMVTNGQVRLNHAVVTKASLSVREGDLLAALLPGARLALQADDSVNVPVLVEDTDFVVVDKPAGVVVHPGAGRRTGTVIQGLLARYPEIAALADEVGGDPDRPGVVHRLDKGTSGVLVVARTPDGFAALRQQVRNHEMVRDYLSLVEGVVESDRGVVDAPLGPDERDPTSRAVRSDGKWARTHYRVVARLSTPRPLSLLELRLETGRTHQIRVHLAAIGHPVVNDLRYGHRRDDRLSVDRPFLHASQLSFQHPTSDAKVATSAPLPPDLRALVGEVI
jgi:23S rRNA pseudouridine1911/1915/1917 synthase